MSKKVVQKITRDNRHITPQIKKPENKRIVIQNIKRQLPKLPAFSSSNLLNQIIGFTNRSDRNYYLGFGGLGDALLLLATCWNDPKAKVVFFANQISFIKSFFELFGISVFLHDNIMGTQMAVHVYKSMKALPNFKESAHLADELNFNDWINEKKYINRIKSYVPWIQHLEKNNFDKPVIIIAPSGSSREVKRQRYLNKEEYHRLVNFYLDKNYLVYVSGSTNDLHYFGIVDRDNFYWLTSDKIYNRKSAAENSSLSNMLRIINSAEQVISMDTWLKSYTLLCGIPTTVIQTRWENEYKNFGEDITDWIFLNPNIWPNIRISKINDLIY